jgi:D-alanine-D-alanine ligase
MKVAICHQALATDSGPDEQDVLEQCRAVRAALLELGHAVSVHACSLDLSKLARELREQRPEVVFNLVECLEDRGDLIALVPALLDSLGLPYTGAQTCAMYATSNKPLAKRELRAAGLPVARDYPGGAERYIVKSVWEHASRGLDAGSVVSAPDVTQVLEERQQRFGGRFFAEEYLPGREFNVSLLARPSQAGALDANDPEVLPIAEICFDGLPVGAPSIVDYAAKWDAASPQYRGTEPRAASTEDAQLLSNLGELAKASYRAFGLRGYARVDFRVLESGAPFILEVNANPCLSADAGFALALSRAGLDFTQAIEAILKDVGAPNTGGAASLATRTPFPRGPQS